MYGFTCFSPVTRLTRNRLTQPNTFDTPNVDYPRKIFEMMKHHHLKLNPLKCAFGVHARNFLEFLVHQRGIEVDQNKEKAIISAKAPQNKKELQNFLGQVNYLRRFISTLIGKTKKFSDLVKLKDVKEFRREKQHQTAFYKIK